ncbi:hypothetical protein GCM10020256_37680 [Streptomyces thermocoprophilus]
MTAVPLVRAVVHREFGLLLVPLVVVALLLVARGLLGGRRGRGRGLARRVVHGDRDTDRATALAAQTLADDRGQPALQYALRELVRYGQQGRVGDQRERLRPPEPVLVLALDALAAALPEKLLQYTWPHCGKIGRYVSHRARSLTGPSNVWSGEGSGCESDGWGQGNESESSHGSQRGRYGSSCCPQPVDSVSR